MLFRAKTKHDALSALGRLHPIAARTAVRCSRRFTVRDSRFTPHLIPNLQEAAQRAVQDQLATMTANNATNGAVIAINPKNGEILAMVGSTDFYNEAISGQVNMAISANPPARLSNQTNNLFGCLRKRLDPCNAHFGMCLQISSLRCRRRPKRTLCAGKLRWTFS